MTGIVPKISRGSKPEFKASLRAANAPKGVKLMHVDASDKDRVAPWVVSVMNVSTSLRVSPKHKGSGVGKKGSITQLITRTVRVTVMQALMKDRQKNHVRIPLAERL